MTPGARDDGAATLLVLTASGLVAASAVGLLGLGNAVALRHRAGVAADAAALAGAAHVSAGSPCAAARSLAAANGATLVRCTSDGAVVEVTVEVAGGGWTAWIGPARLNARAGPADIWGEKRTTRPVVVTLHAGCRCGD